jgi:hypothetical protein
MEYVLAAGTADRRCINSTGLEVQVEKPRELELDFWPANPHLLLWHWQNSSCVLGERPHPRKQSCHNATGLGLLRNMLPLVVHPFLRLSDPWVG